VASFSCQVVVVRLSDHSIKGVVVGRLFCSFFFFRVELFKSQVVDEKELMFVGFFFIYEASDSDFFSVGYGSTRSFGTNLGASRHGFLEHASTRSSKSPNKLLVNDARWRPHKSTRDSAFEIVMDAIL
jgi:hypothetical protein